MFLQNLPMGEMSHKSLQNSRASSVGEIAHNKFVMQPDNLHDHHQIQHGRLTASHRLLPERSSNNAQFHGENALAEYGNTLPFQCASFHGRHHLPP